MSPLSSGSDIRTRSYHYPISDASAVGEARRMVAHFAIELGIDETRRGRLSIIVNELGNNLHKYAVGGGLIVRAYTERPGSDEAPCGLEILSYDRGPGIADIEASLRDGHTTGNTPGEGLGAVKRQADLFDIYSMPASGTAIVAQVFHQDQTIGHSLLVYGAVCLPIANETKSGDGWAVVERSGLAHVMVADGLGHGPLAHEASQAALEGYRQSVGISANALAANLHSRLRPTRGAAVFSASISRSEQKLTYFGIGNIRGQVWTSGETRGLVSQAGTVGVSLRRTTELSMPFMPGSLLLLASDGLNTRWSLSDYPGLGFRHPSLIAVTLWRDHSRETDDSTIFVGRFI